MSAATIRKFFADGETIYGRSYPPVSLQEIKELKVGDPDGYVELGELTEKFYHKKKKKK